MSTPSTNETRHAQVPPPEDVAYPGTIAIHVDASDTSQGIFRVRETIPVKPGRLTLLYPKWIPGDHSPSGPIAMLAGLDVSAGGSTLKWTRDKYDVYVFHVDVPGGVAAVEVDFQYLSPRRGDFEMTDRMLMLEWDKMSLYPAGYYSRGITFEPRVSLPQEWQFGTALEQVSQSGNTTTFKPVSHEALVDSPIYAGRYFKRVDLNPDGDAPVHLNVVADAPKYLEMTPEQLNMHRALVAQMLKLFDSHHFSHYDFLFSLSDHLAGNGLEHHQSSENGLRADYFKEWNDHAPERDLLAHEFEHSWNGKFRRPADSWTPNFNVPMGDSLLWVYEGMTQYWGFVITARAGLWTPEEFREALAMVAGNYDRNRPGLGWRPLADTTNDPTTAHRSALPYRSWQMSEEYYSGGQMLWLAVDAKIRALTQGGKSLDDFAQAFCGMDNGSFVPRMYTRDDVITTLNGVANYDWASFLQPFVDERKPPLLKGIAASGWKLVYTGEQGEFQKQHEKRRKSPRHVFNFAWSIGLTLTKHGRIHDVRWDGPAFRAGVSTGATVKAVNGESYSKDVMQQAIIEAAGDDKAPIELLLKFQGGYRTVQVDNHDGLQYPHLARVDDEPDYLSDIITPRE
ncbi:MAG TPA: peptidase M61 [Gammaproteobacteria bacterium]|nr:peptidase M61 [Gammaproteobacteria bacterium]